MHRRQKSELLSPLLWLKSVTVRCSPPWFSHSHAITLFTGRCSQTGNAAAHEQEKAQYNRVKPPPDNWLLSFNFARQWIGPDGACVCWNARFVRQLLDYRMTQIWQVNVSPANCQAVGSLCHVCPLVVSSSFGPVTVIRSACQHDYSKFYLPDGYGEHYWVCLWMLTCNALPSPWPCVLGPHSLTTVSQPSCSASRVQTRLWQYCPCCPLAGITPLSRPKWKVKSNVSKYRP